MIHLNFQMKKQFWDQCCHVGPFDPTSVHILFPAFVVACDSAYRSDTLSSTTPALASSFDASLA